MKPIKKAFLFLLSLPLLLCEAQSNTSISEELRREEEQQALRKDEYHIKYIDKETGQLVDYWNKKVKHNDYWDFDKTIKRREYTLVEVIDKYKRKLDLLVGTSISYYKNGKIQEISNHNIYYEHSDNPHNSGYVFSSRIDGLWTAFYENGQKKAEYNLSKGRYDGLFKEYYENGQLKKEGGYKLIRYEENEHVDSRVTGVWKEYYESGNLMSEKQYTPTPWGIDTKSIYKSWYENGQKKCEVAYDNGSIINLNYWDQNGIKREEGKFKDTLFHLTTYHDNGKKMSEGDYSGSYKIGKWTIWYENGKKEFVGNAYLERSSSRELSVYSYSKGNEDELFSYENVAESTPHYERILENIRNYNQLFDGTCTWWYPNGQKHFVRKYKEGKLLSEIRME